MTLNELRTAYVAARGAPPSKEAIANGFVAVPAENAVSRVWGGDRRLSLFCYSIETITMLLMPMINTKYDFIIPL